MRPESRHGYSGARSLSSAVYSSKPIPSPPQFALPLAHAGSRAKVAPASASNSARPIGAHWGSDLFTIQRRSQMCVVSKELGAAAPT
ncbi:hypothetical protein, partial [Gordonia sp. UBA7860]|uniref:hypothetical protein n=1 Tax=Gordonia sp. UBA7860 TaxID=1946579 RepID=UPI00257C4320